MEAILLVGLLALMYSVIYFFIFLIKKLRNKEHTLSKKKFYPLLIGGLTLFLIGVTFLDTGIQAKLEEEVLKNEQLMQQLLDLQEKYDESALHLEELNDQVLIYETEIEEMKNENKALAKEHVSFQRIVKELEKDNQAYLDELTVLGSENKRLLSEVKELKEKQSIQVASLNQTSSSSTNTTASTNNSNVYYKNCTEARAAGAAPIRRGEPGYAKHLDRDGDGIGCE
ncbi:excalibur calcium-binding domain-containing protein [Alkalihalobacillus sp. MEB130]|uniref:excalibur calcium-binding domain-containing protein n=1 Tax=Alkalihalobacillus sp. MEB130 TaxID=2976704 RepID=UPI0028DD65AC|nr:excalibur calcium-binding domain-containing protein [Alkalihalobacillus sp. MEB130]MDT8863058.1 excalibur calcium-binding domain-containing protein [Alkalihalobacillus sp. MEB130]